MPPSYHTRGLLLHEDKKTHPGFTLFAVSGRSTVHLVNMKGEDVHQWQIATVPGNYGYLLENGNLLVANRTDEGPQMLPAKGGLMQEMDWQGNVVWEHLDHGQHHDFRRLPNGNTIYIAWRLLTDAEAAGIVGGLVGTEHPDGIYGDVIREVNPDGEIVWEWDAVKDYNPIDTPLLAGSWRREYAHGNTVSPCANGDILINQRLNGLMARIRRDDKQVLWSLAEPSFGQQHDVQELPNGNILFFANGATEASYNGPQVGSRVIEMNPADNSIVWEYKGTPANAFFSWFVSGCQRLENGNTLICEGVYGRIFEVTPDGEIVWDFAQPHQIDNPEAPYHGGYTTFRAYRYGENSPQIQGRLGSPV